MLEEWGSNAKTAVKEDHRAIQRMLVSGNYQRVRAVCSALCLLQAFIMMGYFFSSEPWMHRIEYIGMKALYIMAVLFLIIFDHLIRHDESAHWRSRYYFLIGFVGFNVVWAVVSTFFAQAITSDISIYILVVFAIAATVRIRPRMAVAIYAMGYCLFFFGMAYFQEVPTYLMSHRMNGLILNIIAFTISWMFYQYSVRDIKQREIILERNRELLYLSQHDGLTGLYNHSAIHLKLQKLVEESRRRGTKLSIAMLDIDSFKHINDTFGHPYGDQMIRALASELKSFFVPKVSVGRYGGDEFLLIGRNLSVHALQEMLEKFQLETTVAFSYGIAGFDTHSVIQLIDEADRNMYQIKAAKRAAMPLSQ
jgi:diguanylate cyclase (GGDEF)-like protein